MRSLLPLLLLACASEGLVEFEPSADTDVPHPTPDATFQFAFAVVADPHVTGAGTPQRMRLEAALDWIDANAEARDLRLALLVGDVAWSQGREPVLELLQSASVPVIPIIGDNEVQVGEEAAWDAAFTPWYEQLEDVVGPLERAANPVRLDVPDVDAHLQNLAFSHEGLRFIGVDWASRVIDPLIGELADLNDVDGGSLAWLSTQLADVPEGPDERVVLFTHHPMLYFPGGFSTTAQDKLRAVLSPYADDVYAAFGGHLHVDLEQAELEAGFEVFLTDATFEDDLRVRVVEVWGDGETFSYRHELINVPVL